MLVLPDHAPPRGLPLQHGHRQAPWFDSTELPSITGVSKCCEKRAEASHRLPGLQTNPEAAHGTSTPLQAHLPNRHHQMAPGCPAAPVAVAPTRAGECQQGEKRGNDVPASQGCESPSPPRFSQAALQGATLSALQPPSSDQTQAPALCFGPMPFYQCKIRYGSRKDASKMMHPSSFVHRILSVIDQLLLGAGKTNLKQNIKINRTSKMRYRFAELARGGNRAEAYKPGCL